MVNIPENPAIEENLIPKLPLFPTPEISYLINAFVTGTGVVCNRGGLVEQCCYYKSEGEIKESWIEAFVYYLETEREPSNLILTTMKHI